MPPLEQSFDPMHMPEPVRVLVSCALAIFDATTTAHRLSPEQRDGLMIAATCYAAARQIGAARHEIAGRDAVLALTYDMTPEQRSIIASAVTFQRARLRRRREPAFLWLSSHAQTTALRLSALLMLADVLHTRPATAFRITCAERTTTIHVAEIPADLVADATPVKRWQKYIGPLQIVELTAQPVEPVLDTTIGWELPVAWKSVSVPLRLHTSEPLAEGVRRILHHQFERLLAREQAVRAGEDMEDVHQMRVATRRLRASLYVVTPFFDSQKISHFRGGLRRVAAALGSVRDRDVFLSHLTRYQEGIPERAHDHLQRLLAAITQDRAKARQTLLERLDTPRYARFVHDFAAFLTTPDAGVAPLPESGVRPRIRDAAGSLLWRRYEDLRAFETVLIDGPEEVQHHARIAGKHLRYTIECFAEAIGDPATGLLDPLSILLTTLGELQDEVTARQYLAEVGMTDDPGAQAYLTSRSAEYAAWRAALPNHWEQVVGTSYRGQLLAVLAAL
jgi:CHAD domain-containing protein